MHIAILWFRRDFRLADNAALQAALRHAETVIPVYIHETGTGEPWPPGAASRWWLHHSLAALDQCLRQKLSRLVIRRGDVLEALQALIRETGAVQVHWNRLYEPHIATADMKIMSTLHAQGLVAESHAGTLLHEPAQLKTVMGQPYRVFTPFWKAFQRTVTVTQPLPVPEALKPPGKWPASLGLGELYLLPKLGWAKQFADFWQPGEAGAHRQLRRFLKRALADYPQGRNFPGRTQVSYLSPHLHFGEVSPRQVWHAVCGYAAGESHLENGAGAYLRELGWREFAHHVLVHFPHTTTQPLYEKYRHFPWREHYQSLLKAWQQGRTGYPIVDAGMRELWASGWMHNRVRMLAASLLVKNLRVPWQEGSRWFWDTLVDADLANNTMGWQWSAGCGADAAPYFRVFNPVLQSRRFDPDGDYIRRWLPELRRVPEKYLHAPWEMSAAEQSQAGCIIGKDYPQPVIEFSASRREAIAAHKQLNAFR
ncbi:MAG: deoxyribodipyrimidine photo-lyase [Gammaproteobacteria bacterium]|nr:deoxyribodipyrimidine photo-lyase [Gammaproteobacteria bacterium]